MYYTSTYVPGIDIHILGMPYVFFQDKFSKSYNNSRLEGKRKAAFEESQNRISQHNENPNKTFSCGMCVRLNFNHTHMASNFRNKSILRFATI